MLLSLQRPYPAALLALADGTFFTGLSIGGVGQRTGELVFNTSLTGYQEILTDPSYCQQIVTLTYPHIGNTGVNPDDAESDRIQAFGLVIKDLPLKHSSYRATQDLPTYLQDTVAIAGVDTRALTRRLRLLGTQNACLLALNAGEALTKAHRALALAAAQTAPSMVGQGLAHQVSTKKAYTWTQTNWQFPDGYGEQRHPELHVVAYDLGIKRNILRELSTRGCRLTVVPASTSVAEVLQLKPDGVFFSNGPGDPHPCTDVIAAARELINSGIPCFGICLGYQIMGLACGAKTFKMKLGHHGGNHPVKDMVSGKICITSQNHGFAIEQESLPAHLKPTHISLFDGTLQGFIHADKPAFGFQGHPEAAPGPQDIRYLFDQFVQLMRENAPSPN